MCISLWDAGYSCCLKTLWSRSTSSATSTTQVRSDCCYCHHGSIFVLYISLWHVKSLFSCPLKLLYRVKKHFTMIYDGLKICNRCANGEVTFFMKVGKSLVLNVIASRKTWTWVPMYHVFKWCFLIMLLRKLKAWESMIKSYTTMLRKWRH